MQAAAIVLGADGFTSVEPDDVHEPMWFGRDVDDSTAWLTSGRGAGDAHLRVANP